MKRRAALFALGCRLNQAEAGLLADQLRTAGFEIVPWGGPAELLVVNSCTVTAAAAAKTRNIVRAARKRCPGAFLALTGCDATIAADAWAADNAAVDLILSNADKHTLPERLPAALFPTAQLPPAPGGTPGGSGRDAHAPVETDRRQHHLQHRAGRPAEAGGTPTLPWKPSDCPTAEPPPAPGGTPGESGRDAHAPVETARPPHSPTFTLPGTAGLTDRKRANLKIQEGCNVNCSYCIIPKARGEPRSRTWDDVLRETAGLAARGHREIVLTGINLALYDDHGRRLPELVRAILRHAEGFRLRLSSLEPGPELPRIVELMAEEPRVCRHLHLPLQYADDRILAAMRRPYTLRAYAEFARDAARRIPGLCLGTDIITGFPGETDEIFAACRGALAELPLAHLHVFTFSPRPGTAAAALPGRVRDSLARKRRLELDALGRTLAETFVRSRIGTTAEVLVEKRRTDGTLTGVSGEFLEIAVTGAPAEVREKMLVTARVTQSTGGRAALAEYEGHGR